MKLRQTSDPKYPAGVECETKDCYFDIVAQNFEQVSSRFEYHHCPYGEVPVSEPSYSILELKWLELDRLFVIAMESEDPEEKKAAQLKVRGIAWCISLVAKPFYPTEDDVVKQGSKRYKMAKGKIPHEATPTFNPIRPGERMNGAASSKTAQLIAELNKNPNRETSYPTKVDAPKPVKRAAVKPVVRKPLAAASPTGGQVVNNNAGLLFLDQSKKKLTDEEIEGVINADKIGMPIGDIAKMFGASISDIQEALKSRS